MKNDRGTEHPCPACGGRSYSWGRLQGQHFQFVSDKSSFWRRFLGFGGWRLPARRCDACGLLQIFSEPDRARLSKSAREFAEADFS